MSVAPPLPAFGRFNAPDTWHAIDFLSDLHLSDTTPRTFEALATHLRCTDADAVFILGDLFEVWVGDDARHAGFEAECAAMLSEASSHRFVAFMAGNRDFLVGNDMLAHCGVLHLADPTVVHAFGECLLVSHGDALCVDDVAYQAFRAEVRSEAWQQRFLAQPLPARRALARELRAQSEARKRTQAPSEWSDVDHPSALAWLEASGCQSLLHGHTHRPARHEMAPGFVRHVLSDWDLDHPGSTRADVLRWDRHGLTRLPPATTR